MIEDTRFNIYYLYSSNKNNDKARYFILPIVQNGSVGGHMEYNITTKLH